MVSTHILMFVAVTIQTINCDQIKDSDPGMNFDNDGTPINNGSTTAKEIIDSRKNTLYRFKRTIFSKSYERISSILSASSANRNSFLSGQPVRGTGRLNINKLYPTYQFQGNEYVRVQFALYDLPHSDILDEALNVGYGPGKSKYQRLAYELDDDIVHVKPVTTKKGGEVTNTESLWISVGSPERQGFFLESYRNQKDSGSNSPVIQSFLVRESAIQDIMNGLTTEGFNTIHGLSINVDKDAPNQLGLNEIDTRKLNEAIVPGSLVTYVPGYDSSKSYPPYLGQILPLSDMAHLVIDLPETSILFGPNNRALSRASQTIIGDALVKSIFQKHSKKMSDSDFRNFLDSSFHDLERQIHFDMNNQNIDVIKSDLQTLKTKLFTGSFKEHFSQNQNIKMDSMFFRSGEENYDRVMRTMVGKMETNKYRLQQGHRLLTQLKAYRDGISGFIETNVQMFATDKKLKQNFLDFMNKLSEGRGLSMDAIDVEYDSKLLEWKNLCTRDTIETLNKRRIVTTKPNEYAAAIFSTDFDNKKQFVIGLVKSETSSYTKDTEVFFVDDGKLISHDGGVVVRPIDKETTLIIPFELADIAPGIVKKSFYGTQINGIFLISDIPGSTVGEREAMKSIIDIGNELLQKNAKGRGIPILNRESISAEKIVYIKDDKVLLYDAIENSIYINNIKLGTPYILDEGKITRNGKYVVEYEGKARKAMAFVSQDETIRHLQEKRKSGLYFSEKRDPTGDKIYQDSNKDITSVKKLELDIHNGNLDNLKRTKYNNEIIIKINGDTDEIVNKAANFLQERYTREQKTIHVLEFDTDKLVGAERSTERITFDSKTRVTILGHGDTDVDLKVGGMQASDLASRLGLELGSNSDDPTELGKISVVSCNSDANADVAYTRAKVFGETLYKDLQIQGTQAQISVRNTAVQVDSEGRKIYGIPKDDGSFDWYVNKVEIVNGEAIQVARDRVMLDAQDKSGFLEGNGWTLSEEKHNIFDGEDILTDRLKPIEGNKAKPNHAFIPVADDTGISGGLYGLKSKVLKDKIQSATRLVNDKYGKQWIPLFETAEIEGGKTRLKIYNTEDQTHKTIVAADNTFYDIKSTFEGPDQNSVQPRFQGRRMQRATLGLSIGMSFFGFAQYIRSTVQMADYNDSTIDSNMATFYKVVEINGYIGLADGSIGVANDILEFTDMGIQYKVNKFDKGIKTVSKHVKRFSKVSKMFSKVAMGVGAAASIYGLVTSSMELHNAITKNGTREQLIQAGVQVALDCISVVTSAVYIGVAIAVSLSIVKASAAAMAFCSAVGGPIGVAVGAVIAIVGFLISLGLSLGFSNQRAIAQAKEVGIFFYNMSETYRIGGIDASTERNVLSFTNYAIIEKIDLPSGELTLGSARLYTTIYSSWGRRKIDKTKSKAINIREKLGYSKYIRIPNADEIDTVVLPFTPDCYLSYEWGRLFFCNYKNYKGFDIMKRLKQGKKFDYCFYKFPHHRAIIRVEPEYINTIVHCHLQPSVSTIIVPNLSYTTQKYFTYTLYSTGGSHYISLADGVKVDLRNSISSTKWILLTRLVAEGTNVLPIKLSHTIKIGNATVILGSSQPNNVQIHDKFGTVSMLNIRTYRLSPIRVQFQKEMTVNELESHLQTFMYTDSIPFILIENFKIHDDYVGRAWYDTKQKRFVYTKLKGDLSTPGFKDSIQMLFSSDTHIYYSGKLGAQHIVWSSVRQTHEMLSLYQFFCGNEQYEITVHGEQDGFLMMGQRISSMTFIYGVLPNKITLISISGFRSDVRDIASRCIPTLLDFLPVAHSGNGYIYTKECVYPDSIYLLPLVERFDESHYHFWLYTNTTIPEHQPSSGELCPDRNQLFITGIINPNMTDQCNDLSLLEMLPANDSDEVRYYICYESKRIFIQANSDTAQEVPAWREQGVKKVNNYGQDMLIITNNGVMYKCHNYHPFYRLVGVDETFLVTHDNWTALIDAIVDTEEYSDDMLMVFGLTDANTRKLQAWIDTDFNIVIIDTFNKSDIEYKGVTGNPRYVWLYSHSEKIVILQRIVDVDQDISKSSRRIYARAPYARIYHSNVVKADNMNGRINIDTATGIRASIDHFNFTKLLGVKNYWDRFDGNYGYMYELCEEYNSNDIITLGLLDYTNEFDISTWYHCGIKQAVNVTVPRSITPIFLGIDSTKNDMFFSIGSSVVKIAVNYSPETPVDDKNSRVARSVPIHGITNNNTYDLAQALTVGKTLVMQMSKEGNAISNIPILAEHNSLVLAGGEESGIFLISTSVWLHYDTILFTALSIDKPRHFALNISAPLPLNNPISIQDNDTVIVDMMTENLLVLDDFLPAQYGITYGLSPVLTLYMGDNTPLQFVGAKAKYYGREQLTILFTFWTVYGCIVLLHLLVFVIVLTICRKRRSRPIESREVNKGDQSVELEVKPTKKKDKKARKSTSFVN